MDSELLKLGRTVFTTGKFCNNTFAQAYKKGKGWTNYVKIWGVSNEMQEYKKYAELMDKAKKKPIRKRTKNEKINQS